MLGFHLTYWLKGWIYTFNLRIEPLFKGGLLFQALDWKLFWHFYGQLVQFKGINSFPQWDWEIGLRI